MKKTLLLQILNFITNKATGFIFVNEGDESLNLLTVCLFFQVSLQELNLNPKLNI